MEKKSAIFCIIILGAITIIFLLIWLLWSKDFLVMHPPPPYTVGAGIQYAEKLALESQKLSFLLVMIGWLSVALGGLMALAGAVLGSRPLKDENLTIISVLKSQRGLICASVAVVLAGFGWQCIDRSGSATKTASIATQAIATASIDGDKKDKDAYKACVDAKKAWLEGRMNSDRLQSILNELTASNP